MATCLRLPMVCKPHLSFAPPPPPATFLRQPRRLSFKTNSIHPRLNGKKSESPLNSDEMTEDDMFLPSIADLTAAVAGQQTERSYQHRDPNVPPLINSSEPPTSMASPAMMEDVRGGGRRRYRRRRGRPPTLASWLLDDRIVYIGLPLVPVVTELIVAQLMYLYDEDPYDPVSLYINCTGTTSEDGEPLATDYDGFAIYDALMRFRGTTTIHTICLGCAVGHACLLLACGTKGKRFSLPHAKAAIHPPVAPPSGLMPATNAINSANEVVYNRDLFIKLFARHTGNTVETVAEKMKGTYYMNVREAMKFGVIDHVVWDNQEDSMKFWFPPEEYPKIEKKKQIVHKSIDDM